MNRHKKAAALRQQVEQDEQLLRLILFGVARKRLLTDEEKLQIYEAFIEAIGTGKPVKFAGVTITPDA